MVFRFKKIFDLLVEVIYLGIFFLIPLFFAVFLKTTNVFELNKIVLFKVLIAFLFFLTAVKNLFHPDKIWLKNILKRKIVYVPLVFFVLLLIINYFSIDFSNSLNGLYDWQEGIISYGFFVAWLYLLIINVKSREQIRWIIITIAFSSFFVCLYGLVQASGHDFLDWNESSSLRIISTFGQPNFLASYLLLVAPLSVYLLLTGRKLFIKFFWLILFLAQLVCLFFTYSRAGWLGAIGGVIFFIIFYLWQRRAGAKYFIFRYYKIFLFFLVVFVFLGAYLYHNSFIFKNRVSFNLKSGSIISRLDYWRASLDAIKKKPFFGYGLENQGEVFYSYYQVDWGIHNNVNAVPNRAHNLFLDILLTVGLVGLAAWLAVYFSFFYLAWNNWQNNDDRALSSALAFGAFAYFISLFFGFSVVVTNVYFWGFFALLFILSNLPDDDVIIFESPTAVKIKSKALIFVKIILLLFLGMIFWTFAKKQVSEITADHYFREIQSAFSSKRYFKSYLLYGYLKETGTKEDFYHQRFGLMLADQMDGFYEQVLIRPGKELLKEILGNIKTDNYYDILVRAKIFTALAGEKETNYYDLAEVEYGKIINLNPEIPRNYREVGRMYYKKGDYEKAREYLDLSLEKLPKLDEPGLNSLHRAIIEQEIGDSRKLIEEILILQNINKQ